MDKSDLEQILIRLQNIEQCIEHLTNIVDKSYLDEIPLCYKKFLPEKNESPIFSYHGHLKKTTHQTLMSTLCKLTGRPFPQFKEIEVPGKFELTDAKERMRDYGLEEDKITQVYFVLFDEEGELVGETLDEEHARKWEKEGRYKRTVYNEGKQNEIVFTSPIRRFYRKYRRVLKPESEGESSTSSSMSDTSQQNHPACDQKADVLPCRSDLPFHI